MNTPVFLAIFIIFWAAPARCTQLQKVAANTHVPTLGDLTVEFGKLFTKYQKLKMPNSSEKRRFYALMDLASHDGFLEIEYACQRNFPLDYCSDVTTRLSQKWALYNTAMKQDPRFVELSTEIILGSMENDGLYALLTSSGVLRRIFAGMRQTKEGLFAAFKKG